MAYIVDKQDFYINSRNRVNGTSSDFSYILEIDKTKDFDHVCVISASIPKSYYVVRTNQDYFYLIEDGDEVKIIMNAGNYTRKSFQVQLQSKLNQLSPNGYTYTITYQNINQTEDDGKYNYSVTNNAGVQPQFRFEKYLYEQMGFEINTTNNFVDDTIRSVNVVNLNLESTLFIKSNICQNEGMAILQDIYTVQDVNYSYITFVNTICEETSKRFIGNNANVYSFKLTNEDNDEIDLNGLNLNMKIMLYKKNKIHDLTEKYIKYKVFNDK